MLRNIVYNDSFVRILDAKTKEFYLEDIKDLTKNRELYEIDNKNKKMYLHTIKPYPHKYNSNDAILSTEEITDIRYNYAELNYDQIYDTELKPEYLDYFYFFAFDRDKNKVRIDKVNPLELFYDIANGYDFKANLEDESLGADNYTYELINEYKYNNIADNRFYFNGSVLSNTITVSKEETVELYIRCTNTTKKTYYDFRVFVILSNVKNKK